LRIVCHDSANANHHRIYQGPQLVKVDKAWVAIDISGLTSNGGYSAIHGLAQLSNHHHRINCRYSDGIKNSFEG
jgi:hypothetical protein